MISVSFSRHTGRRRPLDCQMQSSFFISLVELDEFYIKKMLKIGRLDQGLNPGCLDKSHGC